jgi:hypothetical protein
MDFRQHRRYEVNIPVAYPGDEIGGKGAATKLVRRRLRGPGRTAACGSGPSLNWFSIFRRHTLTWPFHSGGGPVLRRTKFGLDFLQMPAQLETRLRKYLKSL